MPDLPDLPSPLPPDDPASGRDPWSETPKFIPSDSPDHPDRPRQRGGQPGNMNAYKHGFYSDRFKETEITDLNLHYAYTLSDEVEMLRVFSRRLIDLSENVQSLDQAIKLQRVLCLTAQSLNRILKTEAFLRKQDFEDEDIGHALSRALADMLKELES